MRACVPCGVDARRALADSAGRARGRHRRLARRARCRPDIAGPLAETAVTLEALDRIALAVSGPPLDAGAPVRRGGLLGPRHRLGNPGSGEADLRAGRRDQRIHAHGPGHGGRARGPDVEPGQHRRGAQGEGASEIGRGHRHGGTGPAAGSRLRRRAESDLGESDRQRARCRARRRAAST